MADETSAVSTGTETPAHTGQSEDSSIPPAPELSEKKGEEKKGGYDALPDYAKDLIRRQSVKARTAEQELEKVRQEMSSLKKSPSSSKEIDVDTQERVKEFERLAKLAGYLSQEEVDKRVTKFQEELENRQREDRDRKELQEVIQKFDGKNLPKVTADDIMDFLEGAKTNPRLKHWTHPDVSLEDIAQEIRKKEIQQLEVDRLLKKGPITPPVIETGTSGKKAPEKKVSRFDSFSQLSHFLEKKMLGAE